MQIGNNNEIMIVCIGSYIVAHNGSVLACMNTIFYIFIVCQ